MTRARHTLAWLLLYAAIGSCADDTGEVADSGRSDAGLSDGAEAAVSDAAHEGGLRFGMLGNCLDWRAVPQPDFDATLVDWSAGRCGSGFGGFPFFVEGACMNGGHVLYSGTGTTTERRFFDATGRFQAVQTGSDAGAPGCAVASPAPFTCGSVTVTRVLCGTALAVGDVILY
jgi:hypothetical protein